MRKVFLFAAALCLLFSFAGCNRDVATRHPVQSSGQVAPVPTTKPVQYEETVAALLERQISFGQNDFDAFEELLSGIAVTYPGEELYNVLENYERAISIPAYVSTHQNFFSDGVFTDQELFEIVKQNNMVENFPKDRQMSDKDLAHVCQIMAPMLLEYGHKMSASEGARLSEKIAVLTISAYTGFAAGSYDTKTGMRLDMKQKDTDRFPRTVQHETHHLLQGSSIAEQNAGGYLYRFGFAYFFEEGKDQPLEFNWIFEGAAELMTHNRLNSREYDVYENFIKEINYIKVATILREDVDETSFEELTLSSGFDGVFDYFGYETEAQKHELLNMLAAINYNHRLSYQDGFRERYKEKYGKEINNTDFRMGLIISLGKSLSREFYINFVNGLKNQTVTVEDVFILNTLFEHRVCDYSLYRGVGACQEMLRLYEQIQTEFFQIVGNKLGVSVEEIRAAYDVYYKNAPIYAADIPLVTDAEAAFLQYTTDATYNKRYKTIHQQLISFQ